MDIKPVHVTELRPQDASAYRDLMLLGYAQDADAFTSTAEERFNAPLSWWLARICHPEGLGQGFGAFHAGALVGGVAIEYSEKTKTRHKALVVGMCVSEPYRRSGVGRLLIQAAVLHAQERRHVRVVSLTVTADNARAVRLYAAAGFEPFGLEPMAIFTGAEYKSKMHMQLQLAEQGPP